MSLGLRRGAYAGMRGERMDHAERTANEAGTVVRHPGRKAYAKPLLLHLGDVRDLTLGGSPGSGDSGGSYYTQMPRR
jgi:hypothetical protein